ncbi:D-glycerate dehydrogenase [Bacteriovorax stolpii]|uniref:D-glycerate dehydrogenase n=1 Tax=Bacteriovorax stolpii TaxID=960 RepID=A0A2K9NS80_BACTC|nr:D-glycerate dehydrogenase [Bacteriovorax stolpii]AUN98347.1 D-glycerate dehydrogenase [Bacteriovorax stolpii]QDK41672.1 D-glycerate dehydrogenase [Bacteriovorax stolpii]TDP52271.1 glyoxylate reductase [Bacteriovorax stolpii]
MKKVFVTRKILSEGLDLLAQNGFEVEVTTKDEPLTPAELMEKSKSVDALICTMADSINKDFLEKNTHLKIITNYAVGVNNIDLEAAKKFGIAIGNTPDVLTEATAEIAFGLMICAARNFRSAIRNAEEGKWKHFEPQGHLGHALKGKILGIVGYGRIGKRLGEMAHGAFGMDVRGYKRGEDLIAFLKDVDVLSLHIPLTPESRHIIGKKEMAALKKTAIVINTARGDVIDQDALYEALKRNEIFAAGLDVTTPEPLVPTHPLYSLPNVMILPHIGSATYEARRAMSIMCAENIMKAFS